MYNMDSRVQSRVSGGGGSRGGESALRKYSTVVCKPAAGSGMMATTVRSHC
jgi:hypothetical protein